MTTHAALLPATRSHKARAVRWTPADPAVHAHAGTLEIAGSGEKADRYEITDVYVPAGYGSGRAFDVRKVKAGSAESYTCFLAADRDHSTCDCPGASYEAKSKADHRHGGRSGGLLCKHLDGVRWLVDAGLLSDPRANGERDIGDVVDSDLAALLARLAAISDPADRRTAFHDAELAVIDRHAAERRAVNRGESCPF